MRRFALAAAFLMALTGCSQLPEAGDVHTEQPGGGSSPDPAPYFRPPGPTPGATPESIVKGFLTAMQANPLSVAAARSFLSERAAAVWKPSGATVVYEASTVTQISSGVQLRLSDAHRLDARGAWRPGASHSESSVLRLTRDNGQWRIDNPPDALVVGSPYFQSQFAPFNLYFYDRAERVLVPYTVYIPRGEQTATTLVRGLLQGPDALQSSVVRSAFPDRTQLNNLSVVVTDRGTAEVPLGQEVLRLSSGELNRAMIQLAWTLRQVTGINRVRITVGGAPVPLADGRTEMGVEEGSEYAATGLGASRELLGLRAGRVVSITDRAAGPVSGRLGRLGYALRSIALSRAGDEVAAVSETGTKVYVAAKSADQPVRTVFTGGTDLLRPNFDLFGSLWLLDRTRSGARVHVISGTRDKVVRVPGVTGRSVTSFAISPDGTRIAVGLTDPVSPKVIVLSLARDSRGNLTQALAPRFVPIVGDEPQQDLGPVIDLGWRTPTQLAVLSKAGDDLSRVVQPMADGSPSDEVSLIPDAFAGVARALAVNADGQQPLVLLDATGRVHPLDLAGKWETITPTRFSALAYAN